MSNSFFKTCINTCSDLNSSLFTTAVQAGGTVLAAEVINRVPVLTRNLGPVNLVTATLAGLIFSQIDQAFRAYNVGSVKKDAAGSYWYYAGVPIGVAVNYFTALRLGIGFASPLNAVALGIVTTISGSLARWTKEAATGNGFAV